LAGYYLYSFVVNIFNSFIFFFFFFQAEDGIRDGHVTGVQTCALPICTGEAHSRAEMMEFNYLSERGAIQRMPAGRYAVDYAAIPGIINDLAKELLEMEATGDRARAEKWFAKYDTMPEQLKSSLKLASDV